MPQIMRLKSLELIGFKSFVDRTVVVFDEGITSIVGPNGAGKSNLVDSIRWVMGEQSAKHLRGSEMSDIIFNGSEARPATGMASVFLTFDNADGRAPAEYASYSEITIGRRLYRSGESEYYINKVPCRHRDIIEFFLGTGVGTKAYSIVEQGQVERIVSARPEERRALLEEAAGISKFKMHRDAALRKIEATKQNLARLADIITELEHQRNSLSRQAKKAERYKVFADELRELDISYASHQYRKWTEELLQVRERLSKLAEDEALKGAAISNEETSIDSMRIELTDDERALNSFQEKIYELQNKLRLDEAEVKFKTDRLAERRTRNEEEEREIIALKEKSREFEAEFERVNSGKVNSDIELASIEETVLVIQQKVADIQAEYDAGNKGVEDMRQEVVGCIRTVSELAARIEQIERQEIDIASKIVRNQTEIDSIDKKITEIEKGAEGAKGTLHDMKGVKESVSIELSSLAGDTEKIKSELQHNETELSSLNQMLSLRKSRLISLEELSANFEGYHEGVRAVMKRGGVFGTISEVVETAPAYETAVAAALGEKLQYVVVKSHEACVEAVDYLKAQSAGRSTFVPLEMRGVDEEAAGPSGEGVIGPLLNHVRFSDEYQKIGKYLFNDIILVEDLEKALSVWKGNNHHKTLVTLDGDVIDPHGIISGGSGSDASKQLLAKRREISELQEEVERLTREVESRNAVLSGFKNRIQVNEARIAQLGSSLHLHDVEFVHKERDVMGLARELDNCRKERDRLTVETAAAEEGRDADAKEKAGFAENVSVAREKQSLLEEKINQLLNNAETKKNELKLSSDELTSKKVQLASCQEQNLTLDKEIKRLIASIAEINSSITAKMTDIANGNHEIIENEKLIDALRIEIGELVKEIDAVTINQAERKQKYDRMLEDVRSKELALREFRKAFEDVKNTAHERKLEETKASEKIFYLEREIQEKYHLDLVSKNEEFELKPENEGESDEQMLVRINARIQELRERLEKIGAVNADAINEYEGVLKRYEFLSKQSEDLKTSLETLQKAIIRINRTSKERFVETFNAVNERFKVLFPRLFHGGGKAELILMDQENVLESGIDIIAQPPGKKLQSVGLLSGGEKALVATTFIFSIFLIKPSPFCLLDEVDAPLDDANIDRFNQLVREMSKISQFILITHNRRTMELADTLYGVTMEEAGISKVVSVRLEQAREIQAA